MRPLIPGTTLIRLTEKLGVKKGYETSGYGYNSHMSHIDIWVERGYETPGSGYNYHKTHTDNWGKRDMKPLVTGTTLIGLTQTLH